MGKPIVLQPGSHTAVGSGLAVAKVLWAEPPGNGATSRVYDAAGNTIATLFYAGRGNGLPEPQAVNFLAPVAVQGGPSMLPRLEVTCLFTFKAQAVRAAKHKWLSFNKHQTISIEQTL